MLLLLLLLLLPPPPLLLLESVPKRPSVEGRSKMFTGAAAAAAAAISRVVVRPPGPRAVARADVARAAARFAAKSVTS